MLALMHVAVTAVGRDRPGIAAAVTKVLFDHGANIEDSRMAILGGHFSMMLIVATDTDSQTLERDLAEATAALDLIVAVRHVDEAPSASSAGEAYTLSVYGADHPGIVYRITAALAERDVNVNDLATRVVGDDPAVYVMLLDVTVPPDADPGALDAGLKQLGAELGVDVTLRPADADTL